MTMKSARPVSAQAQNGSSLGSGEISGILATATSSASSCSRLTILPTSERRTPNLARTRLYSETISSVISQTNVFDSIHSRSSLALGLLGAISEVLSPAIPANKDGCIDDASRPFSFLSGQRR